MHPLFAKNLSHCLSIMKRPHLHHSASASATASSEDLHRPSSTATIRSNYNDVSTTGNSTMKSISDCSSMDDADSDMLESASTPDFATVYASHRFFFSSAGRSNSIVDSSYSLSESDEVVHKMEEEEETEGGVPVETYSPDPYGDFRRSMEEMVEARGLHDVTVSWKSLHELLLCYLSLNPKPTHKYIVAAFADVLVSLMSPRHGGGIHLPEIKFPAGSGGSCGCSCD